MVAMLHRISPFTWKVKRRLRNTKYAQMDPSGLQKHYIISQNLLCSSFAYTPNSLPSSFHNHSIPSSTAKITTPRRTAQMFFSLLSFFFYFFSFSFSVCFLLDELGAPLCSSSMKPLWPCRHAGQRPACWLKFELILDDVQPWMEYQFCMEHDNCK